MCNNKHWGVTMELHNHLLSFTLDLAHSGIMQMKKQHPRRHLVDKHDHI